jgi:isopenicillin N synthase-like dioxygenase
LLVILYCSWLCFTRRQGADNLFKRRVHRCGSSCRGYTPMAEETLDPANQSEGDTKEGLYFGREVDQGDPEARLPLHGPNQWPPPARPGLPHAAPLPAWRAPQAGYPPEQP